MKAPILAASACLLVLGGCAGKGEIDATGGITAIRSACPSVAVPAATGDVTLFEGTGRTQGAIDLAALMTNVRSTCADATDQIVTTITFDVRARRTRTDGPRDVQLPYFITVVRGGSAVVAKRIGRVALHFDAGQAVAEAHGQASSTVARSAATLSDEVRAKLTRKRKAGDQDAAVDPLSQPDVRQAVLRASFEALVGFQLTDDQLKYNATR
ncbi:hypothetical protein U1701_15060 [Sphingomonas sp. PB2P19]|uniref:hypothetical protein n=1 Tax=Sphingomonas rhamnosi TaxID=3096156 RepID=UPI002FCB21E7